LLPVDAPDGNAAEARTPDSSVTVALTAGVPRESRISRALITKMVDCDALILYPFEGL